MQPTKRPLQVVVLGHNLSDATLAWLDQQGNYRVFKILFHIERFDQIKQAAREIYTELMAQGADLSGNTPTIFQPTGSTIGALAITAGWHGLTGTLPTWFNLIRRGEGLYIPSPELPALNLDDFAVEVYRDCEKYGVRVISEDEVTARANAADDGNDFGGLFPMGDLRNDMRTLRRLQMATETQIEREHQVSTAGTIAQALMRKRA